MNAGIAHAMAIDTRTIAELQAQVFTHIPTGFSG